MATSPIARATDRPSAARPSLGPGPGRPRSCLSLDRPGHPPTSLKAKNNLMGQGKPVDPAGLPPPSILMPTRPAPSPLPADQPRPNRVNGVAAAASRGGRTGIRVPSIMSVALSLPRQPTALVQPCYFGSARPSPPQSVRPPTSPAPPAPRAGTPPLDHRVREPEAVAPDPSTIRGLSAGRRHALRRVAHPCRTCASRRPHPRTRDGYRA